LWRARYPEDFGGTRQPQLAGDAVSRHRRRSRKGATVVFRVPLSSDDIFSNSYDFVKDQPADGAPAEAGALLQGPGNRDLATAMVARWLINRQLERAMAYRETWKGDEMAWITGYPREKVDWFPTIDSEKCVKCGMCMNCGQSVYEWTEAGARVARPYSCVVGCQTCANLCLGEAISFPDTEAVRTLYKEQGIWAKVKQQLEEAGKLKTGE